MFIELYLFYKLLTSKTTPVLQSEISTNNQKVLDSLNPTAKPIFSDFVVKCKSDLGCDIWLTSGFRTISQQEKLRRLGQGAAKAGFSYHNYGLAIDCNIILPSGKWVKKADSVSTWNATGVPSLASRFFQFRWGGNFTVKDNVHFDLGNFYDINELFNEANENPNIALNKLDLSNV